MANPNPTLTIRGKNDSAKAFKQARADMQKMKDGAKELALGLAAVGAATLVIVNQTIESTRATRAYSEALGVSVENLSRWEFAADRAGVASDKVGDIMKDTAEKIGDAFRNNAGEAKEAIEGLGLDLEVMARLAPDEQLLAIASALEQVGTRGEKVQILESLGNDLSILLPMLEDNAAGLKEMAARSDELGSTLTTLEAEAIGKVDRAFKDLTATGNSLGQTLTVNLSGAIVPMVEQFNVFIPKAVNRVIEAFEDFGAVAASVWELLNPSEITGPTTFEDALERNRSAARNARREMQAIHDGGLDLGAGASGAADTSAADATTEQRQQDFDEFVFFEESKWRESQAVAWSNADTVRAQRQQDFDEYIFFEEMKLRESQAVASKILEFNMWTSSRQTEHVVGEAVNITRGVAHESRALFEINKIAGISQAVINTHRGVSESLAAYPMPLAAVMAGIHLLAGVAEVNAIRSASFGGGSTGSSGAGIGPVPTPPSDFGNAPNANAEIGPTVQITVEGNVFANDDWRQALTEQLEAALDNDEVKFS